jgi:rhodanese-related sulfurtransferase
MVYRKTIKEIIILVGVAVTLAFAVNTFSPRGIALVGQWDTAKGVIAADPHPAEEGNLQEIDSVTWAKEIYDKGHVLFVDSRSQNNFEQGHIPGAVSLPLGQFDQMIESFLSKHALDQPMVTYCSGRTCEDSHHLARLLLEAGFTDVRVFIDGFPGWEAEGYPVE